MNIKVALYCLVVVVTAASCSDLPTHLARRPRLAKDRAKLGIYDGRNTTIQKHNFMVSLIEYKVYIDCAGAIINEQWVITTGSCLYGFNPSDIHVIAGSQDGISGTFYNASILIVHPQYDDASLDYDYGLIQIEGQFVWNAKIRPVRLPRKLPKINMKLMVSGYGVYNDTAYQTTAIKSAVMKWVSAQTCHDYYHFTLTPRLGCVYNKGKATLCEGDFGDPFVKGRTLHAIFNCVFPNNECTADAGPLIVSAIFPVLDWIKNVTGV